MRKISTVAALAIGLGLSAPSTAATKILFLGNSFTRGIAPIINYKPETVTQRNSFPIGGLPAVFKEFTVQAGLDYDVNLQALCCSLEDHWARQAQFINRPWDVVVMQDRSVLIADDPGNPVDLIRYSGLIAETVHTKNPDVEVFLTATWSRADLTYSTDSPWLGQPIDAMARDLQSGYEMAAAASPYITDVIEVGAAWNDAIETGFADANPYDGISDGQVNLWSRDSYHASSFGSYLSALMQFGTITGVDPRTLGGDETIAVYLGFTSRQAVALQDIAYNRLQLSNVTPGIPEPDVWAMLISGFGLVGWSLRRRRSAGFAAIA